MVQCPKCLHLMEAVTTQSGAVERCSGCKGLWFDMLEHVDLKPYAKQVDIGDEQVGATFNKIDRINCPKCANSQLLRMVDPKQPHIWFESCPVCYGRFYDAGEFRDLADNSFADFVKKIKAVARD